MEPITIIVVPGLLGGLVVALIMVALHRKSTRDAPSYRRERLDSASPDVINMSRIRVSGIGGLGLVAMALAVALDVPRIGASVAIGLVSGVALAVFLIARQRRAGIMPSSGRQMGANTTLSIDAPQPDRVPRTGTAAGSGRPGGLALTLPSP
jgi:hypothetical protein